MAAKIPVGVQLYSVREQAAKDLPAVLKHVRKVGYDAVEFAGYYGHSAYDIKKMLDDSGLKACGTHISMDLLQGENLQKSVDFHKIIGCEYLIVPWIPKERRNSIPGLAEAAKLFNETAEKLAAFGMKTGYHCHHDDFMKVGNRTAWDVLFASTGKGVVMQLDTGNALEGGADPVAILKQFPGRSESVHLKESGGAHGAVLGEGKVDWKAIFDFCPVAGGTKWYVVEFEVKDVDPMQAIAKTRENMKKFGV